MTAPSADMEVLASHQASLLSIDRLSLVQGAFALELRGFEVLPGARIGIVGRNGCGKSTLLEAIVGLRAVTSIQGQLFGAPLPTANTRPALRRRIGCQLQSARFSRYTTVSELLDLHLAMYGAGNPHLSSLLKLDELLALRGGLLSRGQRQRLELYMALAHAPALALLDEPMTGLDRRFGRAVVQFIREEMPTQCAVLVVGHSEEELELVNEVVWLDTGTMVDRGSPEQLIARHAGTELLRIRFHRLDALYAAKVALSVLPDTRCWTQPGEAMLILSGGEDMVRRATSLCPPQDVRAWKHARTSVPDLVRLGSGLSEQAKPKEAAACPA